MQFLQLLVPKAFKPFFCTTCQLHFCLLHKNYRHMRVQSIQHILQLNYQNNFSKNCWDSQAFTKKLFWTSMIPLNSSETILFQFSSEILHHVSGPNLFHYPLPRSNLEFSFLFIIYSKLTRQPVSVKCFLLCCKQRLYFMHCRNWINNAILHAENYVLALIVARVLLLTYLELHPPDTHLAAELTFVWTRFLHYQPHSNKSQAIKLDLRYISTPWAEIIFLLLFHIAP